MKWKSYRKESRSDYGAVMEDMSDEQIKLGCLLRIADATEAMAKNHVQLMADRDKYKQWYEDKKRTCNARGRTISALRGVITKLKKQLRDKA